MILTITLSILLSLFVILSGVMGIRLITLRNDLAEFELRAALLEQGVKKALSQAPPLENSEGFLRFVSESRDWAFQYIEEAQEGIKKFVSEVDPLIVYFDAYGEAGPKSPDNDALEKISVAFKDLKKLLPEETK